MTIRHVILLAMAATLGAAASSSAQHLGGHSPGVTPTIIDERDLLPLPGTRERLTQLVFDKRTTVDPHTHPGAEVGTVTKGTLLVKVADGACARYTEGQMFVVAPNTMMTVTNATDQPATLMSLVIGFPPGHHIDYVNAQPCPARP